MAEHRSNHKRHLAGKFHFVTSFRVLEAGDAYMELVQIVEYEEKVQLHAHAAEGKCTGGYGNWQSLPAFQKIYIKKTFFQKKNYGRDPWDKIILDFDGNPEMGALSGSSEVPKFILHLGKFTSFFQT